MSSDQPASAGKRLLHAVEDPADGAVSAAGEARRLAEDLSAAAGQARADSVAELAADVRRLRGELTEERRRADEAEAELRARAVARRQSERRAKPEPPSGWRTRRCARPRYASPTSNPIDRTSERA
jgi:septal ring factor EnvC (AmiA/AmiB activator)